MKIEPLNSGIAMMKNVVLRKTYLILMVSFLQSSSLFTFFLGEKMGFKEHCKFMHLIHCLCQIADGLAAKNLARPKLPAKLGFNEKIECLQRLEERYYKDKSSDKQV